TSLGGQYASFLVSQLKPHIDSTYRTLPGAPDTGVLGSSMGGLISTYLGWAYTNIYGKVGAMSSAYFVCNPALTPATNQPIRIYLDSGDEDTAGSATGIPGMINDGVTNTVAVRDD